MRLMLKLSNPDMRRPEAEIPNPERILNFAVAEN